MKARHLLSLLLALPLLFAGCNDEPEPTPEPATPELKVAKTTVDFAAEGGAGEIVYELKNAVEGTTLAAAEDAEWITDVVVAEKVTFFVAANEAEEARSAKITLTYGELAPVEVTVNQAAAEAPQPDLEASNWTLVGTHNNWDPAAGVTMYIIEGYFVAYGFEATTASEFKFVKDGAWGGDLGGNGAPAEANCYYPTGSTNIKVVADGKYDIYLNEATDTFYVMEEGKLPEEATEPTLPVEDKWEIVGDFEGNTWGGQFLTKEDAYWVAQDVKFANANNQGCVFKVRNNGAWYGVESTDALAINTGIVVGGGDNNINMNAEVGVAYDFYFDAANMTVWVMTDGTKPGDTPVEPAEPIALSFATATVTNLDLTNMAIEVTFEDEAKTNSLVAYFNTEDKVLAGGEWNVDNSYDLNTVAAGKSKVNGTSLKEGGKFNLTQNNDTYAVTAEFESGDNAYTVSFNGNIVLPDGTNMGAPEAEVLEITEVVVVNKYSEGQEWEVMFTQNDMNKHTHIIYFLLPEANLDYIPSGTYSTADSSISTQYSFYRFNDPNDKSNITDATVTVTVDETAKTATFSGTFTSASGNACKLEWTGEVDGFNFNTEVVDYYTEWESVASTYCAKNEMIINMSSADGSLDLSIDLYHTTDANRYIPNGTYAVGPLGTGSDYVIDSSSITLNSTDSTLASGNVEVTQLDGGYKLVFDFTDELGRNVKGEYSGAIGGDWDTKDYNPNPVLSEEEGTVYDAWCTSVSFDDYATYATFSGNDITIVGTMSTFSLNTTITLSDVTLNGEAVSETGTFTIGLGGNGDYIANMEIKIGADTYKVNNVSFNL